MSHDPDMPKLLAASYTPGRSLLDTDVVLFIAMPGIVMFAFSVTVPTSISVLFRADRNSM
jgi:hypothetical protein